MTSQNETSPVIHIAHLSHRRGLTTEIKNMILVQYIELARIILSFLGSKPLAVHEQQFLAINNSFYLNFDYKNVNVYTIQLFNV